MALLALCPLSSLPDGQSRGFDPLGSGRDTLIVVRRGRQLHGWQNACPHAGGAPMAWRKDAYLDAACQRIVCHAHNAQFEIDTGLCTLGPCLGQRLTAVPLTLNAAGEVCLAAGHNLESLS